MSEEAQPIRNAEDAVEYFLQVAMLPPEKTPKQQYVQRENRAMIIGFNRAQEALRHALKQTEGKTKQAERARALAEVRHPKQERPLEAGGPDGLKLWVM